MSSRWAVAAGVLLVVAAHLPILRAGYVQDDHVAVETSPVASRGDLAEIVLSSYWKDTDLDDNALYRPVVVASYALEHRLGGPSPAASHAINLALHLIATLLLLALARRLGLGVWPSGAAALLFGVHPAKSEAVLNVVGRAEVMAALFALAAMLAFTHVAPWPGEGRSSGPGRERLAAWGTGAFVLLAAASKETGLIVPALLFLLDLSYRGLPARRDLVARAAAWAPTVLAVLVYVVVKTWALEALFPLPPIPRLDNPLIALDGASYAGTALALAARYALLVLAPIRLANDWSGPSIGIETSLWGWRPLVGALLLALLVLTVAAPLLARATGRRIGPAGRALAFAAALTLVPYLVVGNLVLPIGVAFAERLVYLPAAGFCLAIGALVAVLPDSRAVRGVGLALLLLLSARSFVRAADWKDDATVFLATTRSNPSSPRAWFALAKIGSDALADPIEDRAATEEPLRLYARSLDLWPDQPNVWHEKGVLLGRRGDLGAAEGALREAVRLNPRHPEAWLNLGITLQRLGRTTEATRAWRKATLFDPSLHRAWASLGHVAFEDGRFAEAAAAYGRAVALGRADLETRRIEALRRAGAPSGR